MVSVVMAVLIAGLDFGPERWPFGTAPRYDAGRRLVETGVGWRGKSVTVEDNLRALEKGELPSEAVGNVIRFLELNGVDCTKYRKQHLRADACRRDGLVASEPKLGPPLSSLLGHRLGFMLDVSRDKVPTMETLEWLVTLLAQCGYNEFQLYTEHTFAYAAHEKAWRGWSPLTAEEIRALDAFCHKKGIRLVPNQNSFGHLGRWFEHAAYLPLAEKTNGVYTVAGHPALQNRPSMALAANDPKSLAFLDGLYAELLPNFTHADVVNVGCDETWDIFDVDGRSAARVREIGVARVYLEHLISVNRLAAKRGFRIAYWADMALFFPEILSELPKDAIALFWGYGDEAETKGLTAEYEGSAAALRAAGLDVTVCPSTRTFGRWFAHPERMMGNVKLMSDTARRFGFKGLMMTSWGDGGHRTPLLGEVPGLVYAAAVARGETPDEAALAAAVDRLLGCTVGETLLALAKIDERNAKTAPTAIRTILAKVDLKTLPPRVRTGLETYALAADIIDAASCRVRREDLIRRYCELWLRDNRFGGLDDSVKQVFPISKTENENKGDRS